MSLKLRHLQQPAPAAPTPPPPPPPTPTPRIMVNAYVVCDSIYWAQKLFGAGMFTLLATWIFGYAGGIGFQNEPKLEFNIHPLLMSACMVFLNGEAITIYRGNRFRAKSVTKSLHALIQTIVAVFASLGLKAAWDSHNYNKPQPIPNLYSFHSWLGIATFSIFCVQLVGGIGTYLLPYASLSMRKQMMPFHRSSGFLIFILSLSSALLGYSEKSAWAFTCWTKDGVLCGMVIVAHLYAACLVLYALCVILVLLNPDWIRKPLPSEISPSQQRLNPENDHLQPVLELQH